MYKIQFTKLFCSLRGRCSEGKEKGELTAGYFRKPFPFFGERGCRM